MYYIELISYEDNAIKSEEKIVSFIAFKFEKRDSAFEFIETVFNSIDDSNYSIQIYKEK